MIGTRRLRARSAGRRNRACSPTRRSLINPHIKKVGYDPADEFRSGLQHRELPAGVRRAGRFPPLKTMADLIAMAPRQAGSVTVASAGTGNPTLISASRSSRPRPGWK